jgi:TonB family protein
MEMNYVKGKRNGLYLWRSSDGSLRDSGMYVDGKKDGSWKEMEGYRKSERMIHCNYKDGKKDGKFTSYFVSSSSGERITEGTKKKKEEGSYSRGRLNGKYTEWYSSGKKKEESNYADGELRGKRTLYDESGKVILSKVYTADPPPPTREVIMTQVGDKDVGPDVIVEAPVQEIRDYYDQFSVEKTAEFPGGMEELYKFLGKNIKYPQIEKEMNISGKVYVQFIITDLGKIEKVEVIKGIPGGKGLENEALRVLKMMPDWKPALIKGKPVKQIFRLPVNFQLN